MIMLCLLSCVQTAPRHEVHAIWTQLPGAKAKLPGCRPRCGYATAERWRGMVCMVAVKVVLKPFQRRMVTPLGLSTQYPPLTSE